MPRHRAPVGSVFEDGLVQRIDDEKGAVEEIDLVAVVVEVFDQHPGFAKRAVVLPVEADDAAGPFVAPAFRRYAAAPARPTNPSPIMTQVDGSGTAEGIAPGLNRSASELAPPAPPR